MAKKHPDRDTNNKGNKVFRQVMRGTRERTPTAAELAKDAARQRIVDAEAARIRQESARIKALIEAKEEADRIHQAAEEERRRKGQ